MNGLFAADPAGAAGTWVAALVTVVVFGRLLGERRIFAMAQYLLAGLATGYLMVLAVREVLVPRLFDPLLNEASARPALWLAVPLVVAMAGAGYLPRRLGGVPVAMLIGGIAAFALGGAVVGTVLPQLAAGIVAPGETATVVNGLIALLISALVLVSFLHGAPRRRVAVGAAAAGRWLLIGGLGAWLGYLLVSRLALLVDRIGFLLFDWIGIGR
ncbi:MAG: hypothetical protein M3R49_01540 [Chloroflexota bacterium]|nr:hypothetical protein [Chloroflexota bacterium]